MMQRPRDSEYSGSSLFREDREREFRNEIGVPMASNETPQASRERENEATDAGGRESPPRQRSSMSSGGSWRIRVEGGALSLSSNSSLSSLGNPADFPQQSGAGFRPRRREMMAWVVVATQAVVIAAFSLGFGPSSSSASSSSMDEVLRMNNRPNEYYEQQRERAQLSQAVASDAGGQSLPYSDAQPQSPREPFYEAPVVHPKDAGMVERTWRSNGSPAINGDLKKGSCWCSADEWCMCTPSMAVDVILRSGTDNVWMVRRADTGKLALMGGMIEVGETAEQAVHRELREEMNVVLSPDNPPSLFGVYSDPLRDARRHTASIVYVVDVPLDVAPKAGDDATDVVQIALDDIDHRTFFVDHKTMLRDYRAAVANGAAIGRIGLAEQGTSVAMPSPAIAAAASGAPLPLGPGGAAGSEVAPFAPGEPVRRSVCPITVIKSG